MKLDKQLNNLKNEVAINTINEIERNLLIQSIQKNVKHGNI